jgi:hypothetical protein
MCGACAGRATWRELRLTQSWRFGFVGFGSRRVGCGFGEGVGDEAPRGAWGYPRRGVDVMKYNERGGAEGTHGT